MSNAAIYEQHIEQRHKEQARYCWCGEEKPPDEDLCAECQAQDDERAERIAETEDD